jgi:60 kDa SS-A/Ro ribonucleoprotein
MNFRKYINLRQTPQTQPIPGTPMMQNRAGGYGFALDDWARLDRFLILGSEGGTYYASEQTLTVENAQGVLNCVLADGQRAVARIVEISQAGRAPSNDPALFALAICAGAGDEATRRAALDALPKVARIGTHLFHFIQYVEGMRGWGRGLRRAVRAWYATKTPDDLAYQAIKYQQRDGWSHRDLLRLAKPVPVDDAQKQLYGYMVGKWAPEAEVDGPKLIWAYEQIKRATTVAEVETLIRQYNLTWEFVPGQWLGKAEIWRTLLPNLPLGALVRNLARMTANGALQPQSAELDLVLARLDDGVALHKARLHPLDLLVAQRIYAQGKGERGSLTWEPVGQVVAALDAAFYKAFDHVEPAGKRLLLALDVSGSMTSPLAKLPISCREAAAALALVALRTEPSAVVTGFTTAGDKPLKSVKPQQQWYGGDNGISRLPITAQQRLDDVLLRVHNLPFGGTDCALPMLYALDQGLKVDAFVVFTDNETWAGGIHPVQALRRYRERTGIAAKSIVVGMTATGFSIADPNDGGMLDVVGFDTAVPQLMADFLRG